MRRRTHVPRARRSQIRDEALRMASLGRTQGRTTGQVQEEMLRAFTGELEVGEARMYAEGWTVRTVREGLVGLTADQGMDATHLTDGDVWRWLRGEVYPRDWLERLCRLFQCHQADLGWPARGNDAPIDFTTRPESTDGPPPDPLALHPRRPLPVVDDPVAPDAAPARRNAVQLGRIGMVCGGLGRGSSGKTWGRRGWWVERGPWYAARLGNRRPRWRTTRGQARSRRVSSSRAWASTATASRTVAERRDTLSPVGWLALPRIWSWAREKEMRSGSRSAVCKAAWQTSRRLMLKAARLAQNSWRTPSGVHERRARPAHWQVLISR